MSSPVLKVEALSKSFGDFTAVKGISFAIQPGEVLGILGPNGAGKTTTMQMILGLTKPTSGRILAFGMDLATEREAILQRLNFSSTYVQLPFTLTPRENLMVFGRLYGVKPLKAKVDQLIERFELGAIAHQQTKTLSSGQLTRLHLAKALLNDPELLILDEPTASLDPDTADRMRQLLAEEQKARGLAMLVTSHDMPEMAKLCSRLVFLHHGRLLLEGTPEELLAEGGDEDLEALFLRIARSQTGPLPPTDSQGGPA